MHVSIDVICEELAHEGLAAEVITREQRRGISGATGCGEAEESLLAVVAPDDWETVNARHVLLVLRPDAPAPPVATQNLALVRTSLSASEVLQHACSALVALSNWDSRMLEAIAARQGIKAVLTIAAERLANPIALFDSKQALLAYAGSLTPEAEGTIWEDVLLNRYTPLEYYTHDEQERIAHLIKVAWPTTLRPARNPQHEHLSRAIIVNGQVMGTVGQVDVNAPFSPGQVALTDLVCDRLQLALSLRLGNGPGEDDTTYLLRSILNGNKADRGLVAYHLSRLHWKDGLFELMTCSLPMGDEDQLGSRHRLSRVSRQLPQALAIVYEGRIVVLAPQGMIAESTALQRLLETLDMRACVSEPFSDVADARVAYDQCVLGLTATANDNPSTTVTRFSDAYEQAVACALDPALDPHALCDERILALATRGYKGDVVRGRTLVAELYAYLMNGCNAHLTSRQLYLHRNTLAYHVEQIERLLECNLEELPHTRRLFLIGSCLISLRRPA